MVVVHVAGQRGAALVREAQHDVVRDAERQRGGQHAPRLRRPDAPGGDRIHGRERGEQPRRGDPRRRERRRDRHNEPERHQRGGEPEQARGGNQHAAFAGRTVTSAALRPSRAAP
jgi:hypothetical protein